MFALMLGALYALPGCPKPPVSNAVFSATDNTALSDYAVSYQNARATQTSADARASVVAALKADPKVSDARLAGDECSIWIDFADGFHGILNTCEGFADGSPVDLSGIAKGSGEMPGAGGNMSGLVSLLDGKRSEKQENCPPTPPSPMAQKVLLLNASGSDLSGVDDNMFPYIANSFIEYDGWSPDDIVIKSNANPQKLRLNDFFHLDQYGVILIAGDVAYGDIPWDKSQEKADDTLFSYALIQVSPTAEYIDASTWEVIQHSDDPFNVEEAFDKEQLVFVKKAAFALSPTDGSYLYMREDLWQEHMGVLPNSIVYLAAPGGEDLYSRFVTNDTGDVAYWDGPVSSQDAVESMQLLTHMGNDTVAETIFQAWEEDWFPTVSNLYGELVSAMPGDISIHMTTWLETSVTNWPAETQTVVTDIVYNDDAYEVCPPLIDTIQDIPQSPNTFMGLVPGVNITVFAQAIDSAGGVLAEGQTDICLAPGPNEVSVDLTVVEPKLTVEATPDVFDSNAGGAVTVTATVTSIGGAPLAGRAVTFQSSVPGLVILSNTPVTTDAAGKAILVGNVISLSPGEYGGPVTVTISATLAGVDPATCSVRYCSYDTFSLMLSGSADPNLFGAGTEYEASGVRVWLKVTGVYPYDTSWSWGSGTRTAVVLRNNLKSGDQVEFKVTQEYADYTFGPVYLHITNCNTTQTVSLNGLGTTNLTVP